ncbi:MAG: CCR4-Not complex component, Not1-domain-containing protein [Benjaminiella poitrasii]|nr:MAG: CCR4-Not complex component, Not1-domain-containing protein [Benjaminiella poitrasii]
MSSNKMKLYEMFAQKQIASPPNLSHPSSNLLNNTNRMFNFHSGVQTIDLFSTKVEQMLIELDRLVKQSGNLPFSLLPPHHDIILVMRQIPLLINQSAQPTLLHNVVEKVVCQLYRSNSTLAVEVYCRFLQTLLELSPTVSKEVLSWLLYSDDERKNNVYIMTFLVKYGLMPLQELDVKLSTTENQDEQWVEFVTELLKNCLLSLRPLTSIEEHVLVIHALMEVDSPKAKSLIKELQNKFFEKHSYVGSKKDAFEFRLLFAEWIRISSIPTTTPALFKQFAQRILSTVTIETNRLCAFYRLCTETCVDLYHPTRTQSIEAYTKLVSFMIQQDDRHLKLKMTSHILATLVLVLAHHHERQADQFNQKPFLKLFSSLYIELNQATYRDRHAHESFIALYSNVLYTVEPLRFPGFAFSWLQLVSHRLYLPVLFAIQQQDTICFKLMTAHLLFLKQILTYRPLTRSERAFYQGTLRFFVAMLHDYPEFLCEHYFALIQLVPLECVQLRNVILSSFPRTMILPDPFSTNTTMQYSHNEQPIMVSCLDGHLQQQDTLCQLQQRVLSVADNDDAIETYQTLLKNGTNRYWVVNCLVDHLRYPNRHTYFFSRALLTLFGSESEKTKEVVTRVLLERLIVNRPHPWGLLTTFIQLVREPNFMEHAFVKESIRQSTDIQRLFENVLKSTQQKLY